MGAVRHWDTSWISAHADIHIVITAAIEYLENLWEYGGHTQLWISHLGAEFLLFKAASFWIEFNVCVPLFRILHH